MTDISELALHLASARKRKELEATNGQAHSEVLAGLDSIAQHIKANRSDGADTAVLMRIANTLAAVGRSLSQADQSAAERQSHLLEAFKALTDTVRKTSPAEAVRGYTERVEELLTRFNGALSTFNYHNEQSVKLASEIVDSFKRAQQQQEAQAKISSAAMAKVSDTLFALNSNLKKAESSTVIHHAEILNSLHALGKTVMETNGKAVQPLLKHGARLDEGIQNLTYSLTEFNKATKSGVAQAKEGLETTEAAIQADLTASMKAVTAVNAAVQQVHSTTRQIAAMVSELQKPTTKRAYRNNDGSWTLETVTPRAH
jgi:hypothetical protein